MVFKWTKHIRKQLSERIVSPPKIPSVQSVIQLYIYTYPYMYSVLCIYICINDIYIYMSCVYIYTDYTGYRLLNVLPRNAPDDMSKEFSETFRDARDFNKELQPYAEKASADYNPLETRPFLKWRRSVKKLKMWPELDMCTVTIKVLSINWIKLEQHRHMFFIGYVFSGRCWLWPCSISDGI